MALVAYQVQNVPGSSDELPRFLEHGYCPLKKGLGLKWPWLPTEPGTHWVQSVSINSAPADVQAGTLLLKKPGLRAQVIRKENSKSKPHLA